jgi:uncharacterized membrane protein HdeD (DUF308 family)
VLGVLLIVEPSQSATWFVRLIAALMVVAGLLRLVAAFFVGRAQHRAVAVV